MLVLCGFLYSCGGNSGCGTGINSDFAMSAELTPCPMPNIYTTGIDGVVVLNNAHYYDGWFLQHKFTQLGAYNCIHENYYKNGSYTFDMPHYNGTHLLQQERPLSSSKFTLEIRLQAPIGYDAGATQCECPTNTSANMLMAIYTDIYVDDIYDYYSDFPGSIVIGQNDSWAWYELTFAGCQNSIFTNENQVLED